MIDWSIEVWVFFSIDRISSKFFKISIEKIHTNLRYLQKWTYKTFMHDNLIIRINLQIKIRKKNKKKEICFQNLRTWMNSGHNRNNNERGRRRETDREREKRASPEHFVVCSQFVYFSKKQEQKQKICHRTRLFYTMRIYLNVVCLCYITIYQAKLSVQYFAFSFRLLHLILSFFFYFSYEQK